MKKIIAMLLVCVIILSFTGCACEHTYDNGVVTTKASCTTAGVMTYTCQKCEETMTEEIPTIEHSYSSNTVKEPTYNEEGVLKFTCDHCGDSYTEQIPVKEAEVIVTVTEKESIPEDHNAWRFSDYVRLSVNVENVTNRSIKGVQGTLVVKDMFGEEFLRISCDLTDNDIPANGSITVTELYLDVNQFMANQVKLFNTDYEDLIFEYIVTNVIFTN